MGWLRKIIRKIRRWFGHDPEPAVPPYETLPNVHALPVNTHPGDVIMHKFEDEHGYQLSFRVRNADDIWGEHGPGSGELRHPDGFVQGVSVNGPDLRKNRYRHKGATRTAYTHRPLLQWVLPHKSVIMAEDGYMPELEIAVDGVCNHMPNPPWPFRRIVKSHAYIEHHYVDWGHS